MRQTIVLRGELLVVLKAAAQHATDGVGGEATAEQVLEHPAALVERRFRRPFLAGEEASDCRRFVGGLDGFEGRVRDLARDAARSQLPCDAKAAASLQPSGSANVRRRDATVVKETRLREVEEHVIDVSF